MFQTHQGNHACAALRGAVLTAGLVLTTGLAHGTTLEIADTFSINIESDGTFDEITLFNVDLDVGGLVQTQFINGSALDVGSGVSILPTTQPTAQYTTSVLAWPVLEVFVETVLHGPLRDTISQRNMFMTQEFRITNTGGTPISIDTVSLYTAVFGSYGADPGGDDETVQADPATGVTYATDGATTRFAAMSVRSVPTGFSMSYDVGAAGTLDVTAASLTNNAGPFTSDGFDVAEMAVGTWSSDTLAPGASVSIQYAYLFSLDETTPPVSFPIPTPPTWLLLGATVPVLVGLRSRRRAARARLGR